MENLDKKFITRDEFDELREEVQMMSENVNTLTKSVTCLSGSVDKHVSETTTYLKRLDIYQGKLLDVLANKTPDGAIPIESHKQVVRGLIWAFGIVVIIAVGAVKLAPVLIGKF